MTQLDSTLSRFIRDLLDEPTRHPYGQSEIVDEGRRRRRRRALASRTTSGAIGLLALLALVMLLDAPDGDVRFAPAVGSPDVSSADGGPAAPAGVVIQGALPDGRAFTVAVPPGRDAEPEGITGVVVAAPGDGRGTALGETTWRRIVPPAAATVEEGRLRVGAGDWTMEILLYEEVDVATLVASLPRWRARSVGGLPVLMLPEGYRLSRDDDVPAEQAIHFPSFSVVEGCATSRGVCALEGNVMVVPADPRDGPAALADFTIR